MTLLINEFVRKRFNNYRPYVNILILEKKNINIYSSLNREIILEQSNNVQFQMLELIEIVETGPQCIYKIKLPSGKKGYFSPIDSIVILPKKNKQVRISNDTQFRNKLNEFLGMDKTYFEMNSHRVVFSSQYAIYNNELYECLTYIDEIIAFVRPSEVNIMHRYEKPFKVINDTTVYRDSNMTKVVTTFPKGKEELTSQYVIIEEEKLRFKYNGKIYWLNLKDTNLEIEIARIIYENLDEVLLDTILYQNSMKLENYHKYYQKILNKQSKS